MSATCYICGSVKFLDNHHLDCLAGGISSETVPLCRRCHRTYHDWGIGAFSPDTTERALVVENKRRVILGEPPLTLADVKHSSYWYKKHGIVKPTRRKAARRIKDNRFQLPLRLPL